MSKFLLCLRTLLFLMTFVLNVKVHAEVAETAKHGAEKTGEHEKSSSESEEKKESSSEAPVRRKWVAPKVAEDVQLPDACWSKNVNPCAYKAIGTKPSRIEMGEVTFQVFPGAMIVRHTTDESGQAESGKNLSVRLAQGDIWIQTQSKTPTVAAIVTEFGKFEVANGQSFLQHKISSVNISNYSGEVKMMPRGSKEVLSVAEGLQNSLGKSDASGVATYGVPRQCDLASMIKARGAFFSGDKEAFAKEVDAFHEVWLRSAQQAAAVNQILFDRKVAAVEEAKQKAEGQKKRSEAKDQALRALFLRKLSGEE